MRHYEVVMLIHPDQHQEIDAIVQKYQSVVLAKKGQIHRIENWGMKHLAYPIAGTHKAFYALMNIECSQEALDELNTGFKYDKVILRYLVLSTDHAETEPSPMMRRNERTAHAPRAAATTENTTNNSKE